MVRKIHEKKWPVYVYKTTIVQQLPREYERKITEFHKYVINMRKNLFWERTIREHGWGTFDIWWSIE